MKLGSLFDGSGTAPLAAAMCGIEPVWASEIEPYPIKVTKARFPNMLHLGDITKINGAEVEPVDIICGGSPCQDLSVAGKQKGLQDGERSHLFYEMTRIIKEMRKATGGKYPKYVIWENVPGAFSSNNGRDFLAVLQAFAEIADPNVYVPEPPCKGKTDRLAWRYAGSIVGDGWSIAWRTVDAQYWGVPQRRRRIYLVADFADGCAGEILFERKGLSGDSEPSGTQRESAAEDAGRSVEGSGAVKCFKEPQCVVFEPKSMLAENWSASEVKNALRAGESKSVHVVIGAFMGGQGAKARSIAYCDDGTSPTIKSAPSGSNTVPDVVYALHDKATRYNGGGSNRHNDGAANGFGVQNDGTMYTLDTACNHGIVFAQSSFASYEERVGTLKASGGDVGPGSENLCVYPCKTGPLMANSHPGSYTGQDAFNGMLPVVPSNKPPRKHIVRRLTPLECCRLQGFPDWWEDGVEGSDSARYKMWGNGMALPNMLHVMRGIARVEGSNGR